MREDEPRWPTFLGEPNDWGWYEDGIDPDTERTRGWRRGERLRSELLVLGEPEGVDA